MHEPAGSTRTTKVVSVAEVGLIRRWLWEQFNVVEARRPPPPQIVQEVWKSDPIACARSLRRAVAALVDARLCPVSDALAWGRAASLEGRKIPRSVIEADLGLSARAVDGRLRSVDALLADLASDCGFPIDSEGIDQVDSIVLGLIESALLRAEGRIDEADGFYAATVDIAELQRKNRARPLGRDRSVRSRTRGPARLTIQLARPAARRMLLMTRGAGPTLATTTCRLSDDPDTALGELEKSWSLGDLSALPLMLSNAMQVIPDAAAGGIARRRWLLELGSNIFRDAESLTALAWTSSWIEETRGDDVESLRAAIQGRKTRAHVLQLHGFTTAAAEELDRALASFRYLQRDIGDYDLLRADLVIRRAALDAIAEDPQSGRRRLHPVLSSEMPSRMRLSALRYMLHLESVEAAGHLQRRSFSGRQASNYEIALGQLQTERIQVPAIGQLIVLDTIVAAAIRVGDVQTIKESVHVINWSEASGSANVIYRIAGRLKLASKLPGLKDLSDISLPVVEHPLRESDLIPHQLSFLL